MLSFDSTCVSTSAKLLHQGMQNEYPNTKTKEYTVRQVKFTIGFNGLLPTTVNIYSKQKYLGEDLILGQTILQYGADKNDIAVLDSGLKKRITFGRFSK